MDKKRLLMGMMLSALALGGCGDMCYSRNVKGRVSSVAGRFARTAEGGQEKVALRLNPYRADGTVKSVAGGASGIDLECISTRCASLKEGDCVTLSCMHEVRLWEPDIIGCKMQRTIECDQDLIPRSSPE